MIQKGKMTPTTCSLCGQQLTMGIAHICQKQILTHAAVGCFRTGGDMTDKERWDKLRKYVENEVPILDKKPSVILDFLTGYGNAMADVLDEMDELEEEK